MAEPNHHVVTHALKAQLTAGRDICLGHMIHFEGEKCSVPDDVLPRQITAVRSG